MYFNDAIQLNPFLGALCFQLNCLIFLPGDKYFRMSSRKGKHWFQITSYLPDSFPYLCEAVSGAEINACPFATVSIGSKIIYQWRHPQQSCLFPFCVSEEPWVSSGQAWSCSSSPNFSLTSLLGDLLCHWGNGGGGNGKNMLRAVELPMATPVRLVTSRVWWGWARGFYIDTHGPCER